MPFLNLADHNLSRSWQKISADTNFENLWNNYQANKTEENFILLAAAIKEMIEKHHNIPELLATEIIKKLLLEVEFFPINEQSHLARLHISRLECQFQLNGLLHERKCFIFYLVPFEQNRNKKPSQEFKKPFLYQKLTQSQTNQIVASSKAMMNDPVFETSLMFGCIFAGLWVLNKNNPKTDIYKQFCVLSASMQLGLMIGNQRAQNKFKKNVPFLYRDLVYYQTLKEKIATSRKKIQQIDEKLQQHENLMALAKKSILAFLLQKKL